MRAGSKSRARTFHWGGSRCWRKPDMRIMHRFCIENLLKTLACHAPARLVTAARRRRRCRLADPAADPFTQHKQTAAAASASAGASCRGSRTSRPFIVLLGDSQTEMSFESGWGSELARLYKRQV